jgi:hypothetical protein
LAGGFISNTGSASFDARTSRSGSCRWHTSPLLSRPHRRTGAMRRDKSATDSRFCHLRSAVFFARNRYEMGSSYCERSHYGCRWPPAVCPPHKPRRSCANSHLAVGGAPNEANGFPARGVGKASKASGCRRTGEAHYCAYFEAIIQFSANYGAFVVLRTAGRVRGDQTCADGRADSPPAPRVPDAPTRRSGRPPKYCAGDRKGCVVIVLTPLALSRFSPSSVQPRFPIRGRCDHATPRLG